MPKVVSQEHSYTGVLLASSTDVPASAARNLQADGWACTAQHRACCLIGAYHSHPIKLSSALPVADSSKWVASPASSLRQRNSLLCRTKSATSNSSSQPIRAAQQQLIKHQQYMPLEAAVALLMCCSFQIQPCRATMPATAADAIAPTHIGQPACQSKCQEYRLRACLMS